MCVVINDVSEIFSHWGNRLRAERVAKGLTQYEVADLASLDTSTVSRVEAGTAGFSGYAAVAAALGLAVVLDAGAA